MILEDREMAQIEQLRAALAGDVDADRRFRAATLLAGLLGHRLRAADAADVLEDQLEAFAARPDLLRATEAALVNVTRIDPATRARAAGAIDRLRDRVDGGEERDPAVLGTIAAEMAMAGEPAGRTAQVAARAVTGTHATDLSAQDWSWYGAVRALVAAERFDPALRELDRALDRARARSAAIDAGGALAVRADLLLRTGKLARAEATALALREIARTCGLPVGDRYAVACLGEVLIERGRLDDAERLLMDGPPAAPAPAAASAALLLARGRLRLAQGRAAEAAEELRACGARAEAIGIANPALVPWRSRLAEALLDLGEVAEARRLAAGELADARRFGAPRAIGIALRVAARAAGGEEEIRLLREAVAILEGSRLERARAAAALGAALRRTGHPKEARDPLRTAVDLAHRCGAAALEETALAELHAAGARPRRRLTSGAGALTPSERRIAELAAAGRPNREIAEVLVVTLATVEYHLRHAYRKLGIASRAGLHGALTPEPTR